MKKISLYALALIFAASLASAAPNSPSTGGGSPLTPTATLGLSGPLTLNHCIKATGTSTIGDSGAACGGGGGGGVSTVSVVSANGLAGTVANATTTPAITLSTTINGILSGNGTAISAASTSGTGAVCLVNSPVFTTPNIGAAVGSISGNAGTATALATGRTIGITGDITYTSPSFDGSGNVTAGGTLATVNSNVGSFGSGTAIPNFTVNGKGLLTAAGSTAVTGLSNAILRTVGITADGGGSAPTAGIKGYATIPYSGTITGYTIISDQSGSAVFDVWKRNDAVPTIANTIVASAPPTLSSSQYVRSTTLTGWTTSVAANDVIGFNLNSASGLTRATLVLYITNN